MDRSAGESLLAVVIVVSTAARQEVIEDEIGDVETKPVPGRQVVAEMHARENAALRRLVGSRRDAAERSRDVREYFGRHGKIELVSA